MNFLEPFHEGEVAVQERTCERADAVRRGAMIRDSLTPAAQDVLNALDTIALATVDESGRPWASLWPGSPGFITCPSDVCMRVSRPRRPSPDDPISSLLTPGREVGTLGIDFATRARIRVNGLITGTGEDFVDVGVREAFPNCKKYIQPRVQGVAHGAADASNRSSSRGRRLGPPQRAALAAIDTFFVASRHVRRGVDVSHRGGAPGFVRVLDAQTLRVPDYPGNGMYQTLGNIEVDARAGLLAVDFEAGRLFAMTGRATMTFGSEDPVHSSWGTGRYWEFAVDEWVDFPFT